MKNTLVIGVKFGILLGLLNVANVQILTWLGLGLTSWVIAIDVVLLVFVVGYAHLKYKSSHENVLHIKDALLLNVAVILVASLIDTAYMYVYITQIDPDWVDRVADIRRQLLVDGGADSGSIEARIESFRSSYAPFRMFTWGIFMPGLWSFLFAGIVVLFTRNKRLALKA